MQKSRCKLKCISKTTTGSGENLTNSFKFMAVSGGSDENKEFFKWSPSANFELNCVNPSVDFEPDKEYYLDLTPAE